MRTSWKLTVLLGAGAALAAASVAAQEPPPAPTLGDKVKDLWDRVPAPVKARARDRLLEIIDKHFGGARPVPPPPPPPRTKKEKAAAERARKAELAKLRKLERERKAKEAKARKAAAKAARAGGPAPAAAATTPPPAATPPSAPTREALVPLERRGSSYYVAARLNDRLDASLLYDTGASLSTVDRATLQRLGVALAADAPTIRIATANGVVDQPLLVLDAIEVGGARIGGGFTVGVCDQCSSGGKIGLLGLNFSRRFLVTLDDAARTLRLTPRADQQDHRFDIEPFFVYEGVKGQVQGGQLRVEGQVRNRGPRPARGVKLAAVLVDDKETEVGRVHGSAGEVPAGKAARFSFSGRAPSFAKFYLELESADW